MEIQEAVDQFLLQLEADGRSIHTRGNYARHLRLLRDWLRTERACGEIEAVTHQDLAAFLAAPQARTRRGGGTKSPSTMNALRSSVRMLFGYTHRCGMLREDPSRLIRRALAPPPPPRALTPDEERRLLSVLAAADDLKAKRDESLILTMLRAGLRAGSAIGLDVEDLDLAGLVITVRTMKGGGQDRVLMPADLAEHLRRWLGGRTSGPVFVGFQGERLTVRHAGRRVAYWLELAGIARVGGCHCLRHAFGMRVYERSQDVLIAKAALHHRSITSTMAYVAASEARVREALG